MINVDWLQINQTSLFVFLVALVSVIRERKVLGFLLVFGAFLRGDIMAVAFAFMVTWYRSTSGVGRILKVKDTVFLFFMIAGAAMPSPFREFMICFGVLGFSVQMQQDSLSVMPALLLTQIYFGGDFPLEVVLGASGFLILLKEILILAKVEKRQKILQWLELPVLAGVLFPFKGYGVKVLEDQVLLVAAPSIGILVLLIAALFWIKQPVLKDLHVKVGRLPLRWLDVCARVLPAHSKWIQEKTPEETVGIQRYFEKFFWGTIAILIAWMALLFSFKGGLG